MSSLVGMVSCPGVLLHQVADGVLGLLMVPEGVAGAAADQGCSGLSQEGGGVVVEGADEEPLGDLLVCDVIAYALPCLVGAPAGKGQVGDVGRRHAGTEKRHGPGDEGMGSCPTRDLR